MNGELYICMISYIKLDSLLLIITTSPERSAPRTSSAAPGTTAPRRSCPATTILVFYRIPLYH